QSGGGAGRLRGRPVELGRAPDGGGRRVGQGAVGKFSRAVRRGRAPADRQRSGRAGSVDLGLDRAGGRAGVVDDGAGVAAPVWSGESGAGFRFAGSGLAAGAGGVQGPALSLSAGGRAGPAVVWRGVEAGSAGAAGRRTGGPGGEARVESLPGSQVVATGTGGLAQVGGMSARRGQMRAWCRPTPSPRAAP